MNDLRSELVSVALQGAVQPMTDAVANLRSQNERLRHSLDLATTQLGVATRALRDIADENSDYEDGPGKAATALDDITSLYQYQRQGDL